MYTAKHYNFQENDIIEIEKLVHEFGFATLISVKDGLPWATHLPLELKKNETGEWLLYGHVAKANETWRHFEADEQVLAIFMGPHSYISPSWYSHKNVPTWNYQAVHLYGKPRLLEGDELQIVLAGLMARYENAHVEKPLSYSEIPGNILQADLRALVGFEIRVERIEAVSKLSQNRDDNSYATIIEELKKLDAYDAPRIAEEMEKRRKI
jgi:transcriptional regulator